MSDPKLFTVEKIKRRSQKDLIKLSQKPLKASQTRREGADNHGKK